MKILIITNKDSGLYVFRKELLIELLKENEVVVSCPQEEYVDKIKEIGCKYAKTELDRHGINPLKEVKTYFQYLKIIKSIKPDVVLTYTIKPNIYAGIICKKKKIPYIVNVTGLGIGIENSGCRQKVLTCLYKKSLKKAQMVFFQNSKVRYYWISACCRCVNDSICKIGIECVTNIRRKNL